ncbi:MAG: hypothetical protein PHF70_06955, partial [Opitutales bacterium]|nr:hypothetical protein [Opitutales bacterium]
QVFLDRGSGFREEDSGRRRIPAKERQNIVIPLDGGTYKGFRIDPVDNASRYELSVIEITRISGETDRSFALCDWFSHGSGSHVEDTSIFGGGAGASPDPWHALALDPPLIVEQPAPPFGDVLSTVLALHGRALMMLALVMALGPTAGLLGCVAFFFRVVFDPGFYSPDSIDQISQARIGQFWDQHPVAMALILQAWMKLGLTIRDLIFAQALAGLLGVQYAAMRVLEWFPGLRVPVRQWIAFGVAVLLSSPLSPLPWYLNTLWKDSWTAILFVWVGGLSIGMLRTVSGQTSASWIKWGRWSACFAAMLGIVLIRHNALVLVPFFVTILVLLFPVKRLISRIGVSLLLMVIMVGMNPTLHALAGTHRTYMKYQLYMMDLIGMARLYPESMEHLSYTRESLQPGWEERFQWANIYPISFNRPLIVSEEYGCWTRPNPRLEAEYRAAWKRYPVQLLRVKWEHYWRLFGLQKTHYWHDRNIVKNDLGIRERWPTASLRKRMSNWSIWISASPLRWFGGVHAVWAGLNLLICLWLVLKTGRCLRVLIRDSGWKWTSLTAGSHQLVSLLILLLIPLGYTASFYVASPARDFRYMYPATLLMQVWLLSFVSGWLADRLNRHPAAHQPK